MKHTVAELEGVMLDAAVAKAEAIETIEGPNDWLSSWDTDHGCWRGWSPTRDWRVGGQIIERERIGSRPNRSAWTAWVHTTGNGTQQYSRGKTALIAAMRAYVASRFGDEIELP